MIVRREKVRKELHRTSMDVFYKQNDILLDNREDLSGDNLDFIRHRTTKFSCFSEHYQTEKQYENEYGTRPTIFDSTLEEGVELLNSSQIERLDLIELEPYDTTSHARSNGRSAHTSGVSNNNSSEETKVLTSCSKNGISNDNKKIDSAAHNDIDSLETKITAEKSEAERNIFELLEPKTDESLDDIKASSPNKVICKPNNVTSGNIKKLLKKSNDMDSTNTTHLNGYLTSEEEINVETEESDCAKTPLPNNTKTSRLVKKGKKRFRNLHKIERQGCRNSPRLNKISIENEVKLEEDNSFKNEIVDENRFSKIIHEVKRRRLTISGEYISEYDEEPTEYVRVTRSRLASFS